MIVGETYTKNGQPNRLRNMRHEATLPPGYVELVAMPTGVGPWAYDAASKSAVPSPPTEGERLDRLHLPPRVLAALVARAAPSATAGQRAWAGAILDAALDKIEAARDGDGP